MAEKVLYLKGGRAIEEAIRLYPRRGELQDGGPDKFLLAVLFYSTHAILRLCSFGPKNCKRTVDGREVYEYAARSESRVTIFRRLAFLIALAKFTLQTIWFKPNCVLCGVDGPFALGAWLAARISGAKFIYLAHSALGLPTMSTAYRVANRFLCRHADTVIAHGPFVKNEALELGASPSAVIEFNNGLDPAHRALIASLNTAPQTPEKTILYVGRMEADKGVIDLLDAFNMLPIRTSLRLVYVGNGGAIPQLKQEIISRGLSSCVSVLGAVPFEHIFQSLKDAAVVVTPSQSSFPEGFCKSAMEAFFVGTPVIAPNYGPFPYMIKDRENGLLYEVNNVSALSNALLTFFKDEGLQEALRYGARQSGVKFATPDITFNQAISKAMSR